MDGAGGMDWADILLVIVVVISTGLSSFFSVCALRHAQSESARLANVASANLIIALRKPWSKGHFKAFLTDVQKGISLEGRESEIEGFLNQMEKIAMFMEQETLKEIHVKELFASHFKLIIENKYIRSYYNNKRKENEKYFFTNIAKVLAKIEKWDA